MGPKGTLFMLWDPSDYPPVTTPSDCHMGHPPALLATSNVVLQRRDMVAAWNGPTRRERLVFGWDIALVNDAQSVRSRLRRS